MLPTTIASIRQAIKEFKSFGWEDWEGEGRVAARRVLQEVLEHRMHNLVVEGDEILLSFLDNFDKVARMKAT